MALNDLRLLMSFALCHVRKSAVRIMPSTSFPQLPVCVYWRQRRTCDEVPETVGYIKTRAYSVHTGTARNFVALAKSSCFRTILKCTV